eukprot:297211_1
MFSRLLIKTSRKVFTLGRHTDAEDETNSLAYQLSEFASNYATITNNNEIIIESLNGFKVAIGYVESEANEPSLRLAKCLLIQTGYILHQINETIEKLSIMQC